jgi:FkbM family methyltransferase
MKLLFDIGANRGLYTDANIDKYDLCILVEANPALANFLESKYRGNEKIRLENVIISNKESETFYVSNADTISTVDREWITQSRFSGNYTWQPVEGISTVSLDSLIQKYGIPQFLKVDVEGYEYNVLQSLTQKVPSLCFEWAEEKKEEILLTLTYLQTLGYTRYALQFEDSYGYQVQESDWIPFETIYSYMNASCDTSRKEKWGMIWAS